MGRDGVQLPDLSLWLLFFFCGAATQRVSWSPHS